MFAAAISASVVSSALSPHRARTLQRGRIFKNATRGTTLAARKTLSGSSVTTRLLFSMAGEVLKMLAAVTVGHFYGLCSFTGTRRAKEYDV